MVLSGKVTMANFEGFSSKVGLGMSSKCRCVERQDKKKLKKDFKVCPLEIYKTDKQGLTAHNNVVLIICTFVPHTVKISGIYGN